jgi:transcriptional regulator with XRE-family HTH domain
MSELIEKLRNDFQDEEYRHSYAEECLNTIIATQLKVLREQRELTQRALAKKCDMKQPRITVLEDSNYSNWSINTLKRLARAFDVALSVKFEAFSDLILDFENMSKESLERPSFNDDPLFSCRNVISSTRFRRHRHAAIRNAATGSQLNLPLNVAEVPLLQTGGALMPGQGGRYEAGFSAAS